jgi:pilus assembly protein CpaC
VKKKLRNGMGSCWRGLGSGLVCLGLGLQAGTPAHAAEGAAAEAWATNNAHTKLLHVVVGHTFFLNTSVRLKRVYVSNPVVLSSLTSSLYEVLITAKTAGVSSVVVWDTSGQSTVYTVSADLDADGLRHDLAAALPKQPIRVSALQDRIELSGSVATQEQADIAVKLATIYSKDIANSLTIKPARVKQVELKVRFIEVDRIKLAQFGVNLLSNGQNIASSSTQQFGLTTSTAASVGAAATTITNPLNLLLYNQNVNVGVAIQDLEQHQVVQTLAEPTITSISGEEASFLSGGEFPFPVIQGGVGTSVSVTIQFRPYGVKLVFTPTVNPDGTIRLKVAPEVSALDYTNEVVISGYNIPALTTRRAQTDVELQNGQSFAISGLLDRQLTDTFSKMPGIASIPILGQLFRSKNSNTSQVELVVIVTPTVVDPLTTPRPIEEPKKSLPFLDPKQFDDELKPVPKKSSKSAPQPKPAPQPQPATQSQPQTQEQK